MSDILTSTVEYENADYRVLHAKTLFRAGFIIVDKSDGILHDSKEYEWYDSLDEAKTQIEEMNYEMGME